jgi:O-antigen/teichoic acid export membrane protein
VLMLVVCTAVGAGLAGFTIATSVAALITAMALFMQLAAHRTGRLAFRMDLFRSGLGYAFRAYFALLLAFVLQRLGVLFLAWFRLPADVGQFSVAMQIHDVLLIAPGAIGMVLLPTLIRQGPRARASLRGALAFTALLMAAACLTAAVVGGVLIRLAFGESFAPAYPALLWLLPGVFFLSLTTVLSQFLVNEGFPILLVGVWFCGLVAACAAGVVLVRQHGAVGASVAQSVGALVVCVGTAALSRRSQLWTRVDDSRQER